MRFCIGMNRRAGVSLVELLVVITVITILAAIVLPQMTGLSRPAEHASAQEAMERANRAVNLYEQSVEPISVTPSEGMEDEAEVFLLLQSRRADVPGSPLLDSALSYPVTTDEQRPRAFWDGEYFRLLAPGEPGAGLDFARPQLEN